MKNKSPYVIACAVLALDIKHAARELGTEVGNEQRVWERPGGSRARAREGRSRVDPGFWPAGDPYNGTRERDS